MTTKPYMPSVQTDTVKKPAEFAYPPGWAAAYELSSLLAARKDIFTVQPVHLNLKDKV